MTPQEFNQRWGAELVTASPAIVEDLRLPVSDKEFLTLAGLPLRAAIPSGGDFACLPVEVTSPRQETDADHRFLEQYGETPFLRLGYILQEPYDPFYASIPFVVEESRGRVGLISPDQKFDLINSSVAQFASALLEYRVFSEFGGQNQDHLRKVRRRLRELERSLKASDAEAFSDENYYWPVWVSEIELVIE